MTVTKSKSGPDGPKPQQKAQHSLAQSLPSATFGVRNLFKKLLKLILVLVALVSYTAVLPVFFIFMLPMYIYRGLVIVLQKTLKPDWVCIMSSRDAIVGLDDTTKRCECIILASLVFRGKPDLQKCQEHFKKNVLEARNSAGTLLYRKMTYYYENWLGFPFWKKEADFKLEEHLRLFDYKIKAVVSGKGDEEKFVTEDELLKCLGDIEALPFGKGKSPWEILVLPNFIPRVGDLHRDYSVPEITIQNSGNGENERYFALLFRVHHTIGDGYSFLKMLMCHLCCEPVDTVPRPPTRDYNFLLKMLHSVAILIFTPYYHFKEFFMEIDRSIWHLPERKLSKKSHFVTTERIPMDSLKRIGKSYKVPLTGVFLAGLAGGIHNFLKLTGKGHRIPKYMRAFSPMPWKDHPALITTDGMANHWTCGVFAIPVAEDTPLKRMRAAKKSMRELASSPILVTNFFTIPVLLSAPNFLTDFWGTNWMTSMILSNFPGPVHATKSFGEYALDNLITYVPHMRGSAGLGIMFPTCMGSVRCTVSVDTSILSDYSDVQFLVSLIDEEFRILRTLHSPNAENRV